MSNTTPSLQERLAETRAVAEASMALRILNELVNEPDTRRFNRSRAARIERWLQIEQCAVQQSTGLMALTKDYDVPTPPVASTPTTVPIHQGAVPATAAPPSAPQP